MEAFGGGLRCILGGLGAPWRTLGGVWVDRGGSLGRIVGVPGTLFGGGLEGKGVILESFWMIKEVFDVFLEKM